MRQKPVYPAALRSDLARPLRSCRPGWHPWFVSESEATELTQDLAKVARLVDLRRREPNLYESRDRAEVPIVSAGDEALTKEELEWVPLLPPLDLPDETAVLSEEEQVELVELPVREDCMYEFIMPLVPKSSVLDEKEGRPCFTRLGLMSDRRSYFVLAVEFFPAMTPLHEIAGRVLVNALRKGKARPKAIHITDRRLLRILGSACHALRIPLEVVSELHAAPDALRSLLDHLSRQDG